MCLISVFGRCSQIISSSVETSTEADTLPVCSTQEYCKWVKFLRKWPQNLRGDAFWKLKKTTNPIMGLISVFGRCSQVMSSGIEMSTEADTPPVCSTREYCKWVKFLRKWPQNLRGDAFWKLKKNSFFQKMGISLFFKKFQKFQIFKKLYYLTRNLFCTKLCQQLV